MHYHLSNDKPVKRFTVQTFLGLTCVALFLGLMFKIWVPYALAFTNATVIRFLPPDWAQTYIEATLPKTAFAQADNKLIIHTDSLHIEAPIVEGTDGSSLLKGVGHDPASSLPGSQGRVVLSGHRYFPDSSPWATVFFSLDRLKVGDQITVLYNGQSYNYHVTESWEVPKDQAAPHLAPTTAPLLTIYTCNPTYSSKRRLGFTATYDETKIKSESNKVIDTFQEGILP